MGVAITVVVPADAETVWREWTDFGAWPSWNPHCVEAELDGPLAPGSRLALCLRPPRGRDFYTKPYLTVVDPESELVWEARGLGLRARVRTAFTPEHDGTRLTVTTETEGRLAITYRLTVSDRTHALMYVAMLDALSERLRPA